MAADELNHSNRKSILNVSHINWVAYLGAIFWPSFLIAGVATTFFFAMFDPTLLGTITTWPIELSREMGYTLGFFLFWLITVASSLFTVGLLWPLLNKTDLLNKTE